MHYELVDLPMTGAQHLCATKYTVSQALDALIVYIAMCHVDVKNKKVNIVIGSIVGWAHRCKLHESRGLPFLFTRLNHKKVRLDLTKQVKLASHHDNIRLIYH